MGLGAVTVRKKSESKDEFTVDGSLQKGLVCSDSRRRSDEENRQ